ncbi:MAG: 1-acyl-sn-glycerol-3-phosphate acyltransferase [Candidatus Omnitrophica bacterium]|nr:1-acyl-sn-glycerol-3-phosphate acyltransferase [Candidatus Omnitrophota bacterium]
MRILKLIYLNVTFYTLFIIFSLVAISLSTFFIICCRLVLSYRQTLKCLRIAILWYATVVIRILAFPLVRLEYKNYTQDDLGGPCIFICNHRSASDAFLSAVVSTEAIQIVNIWPFRFPVLGIIAKLAGYLSVREMPFEDFLVKATKLLREGVSVIVFPEGTRSTDNSIGSFHGAIFRVALKTKSPIVPLCIAGNKQIPPKGSAFLHPGLIKVHRLKPILWKEYGAFTPFKFKNYVRQIIIDEVADMERCA